MTTDRALGDSAYIALVKRLDWFARPGNDVVAAGRFVAYKASPPGERIGEYDVYLTTSGEVEVWEDANPDDPEHDGRVIHAHRDWDAILTPMFRLALAGHTA